MSHPVGFDPFEEAALLTKHHGGCSLLLFPSIPNDIKSQLLYPQMALYMNRIIDFDLTKSEGKFTVKAGVDPDLDMSKL